MLQAQPQPGILIRNNMVALKEITVYTVGNSSEISTWSNVPYYLTETLISKGIKVNRVDISPSRIKYYLFKPILLIIRIFYRDTSYSYFRSFLNYMDVKKKIKKAIHKFKDSQANLFLTFSFSSCGLTSKPAILVCDWSYGQYINYFFERKPDIFEKKSIRREDRQIEGSNFIFPLHPGVMNYMKICYKNKKILYLGNACNSFANLDEQQIIEKKISSNDLLFIGGRKYKEGACTLIEAYQLLKDTYPDLSLHIIGMRESDFEEIPSGVHCHGYLDKGKEVDRRQFYSLLENAKVFINTNPKWGAFTATLEVMHHYTPVITTPYDEFVETFSSKITFGSYCEARNPLLLKRIISNIFSHPGYRTLCKSAHESVRDFTWDRYIDRMLEVIQEGQRENLS
jgi:glycosyltransferase involved in cell wall biosynthesis